MSKIVTVAFFNNKGGVGKTTLACNFASWISRMKGKKVVVIDCDPQANATQLSLFEEQWDEIYEDIKKSRPQTLLHVFQEIIEGNSGIRTDYKLHRADRFEYEVLAAHPNLASIEDRLSTSWGEFRGGILGGANRTVWMRRLCESLRDDHGYDYVIIDMGPSLGALNRSILLACDAFITPVEPSLFSQYALLNIGTWVTEIISEYNRSREDIVRKHDDIDFSNKLPDVLPLTNGWIGYTIQQYLVKKYKKEKKVVSYEYYKSRIESSSEELLRLFPFADSRGEIGTIPYMFSMAPRAQAAHAPIACLVPADGLIGGQAKQRDKYSQQLEIVFQEAYERICRIESACG